MLPNNIPYAREMLQKMELFYAFTLDNVMAAAITAFNAEFDLRLYELMHAYTNITDQLLLTTGMVCWVQPRLYRWFRTQILSAVNLPAPDLTSLCENIENGE